MATRIKRRPSSVRRCQGFNSGVMESPGPVAEKLPVSGGTCSTLYLMKSWLTRHPARRIDRQPSPSRKEAPYESMGLVAGGHGRGLVCTKPAPAQLLDATCVASITLNFDPPARLVLPPTPAPHTTVTGGGTITNCVALGGGPTAGTFTYSLEGNVTCTSTEKVVGAGRHRMGGQLRELRRYHDLGAQSRQPRRCRRADRHRHQRTFRRRPASDRQPA